MDNGHSNTEEDEDDEAADSDSESKASEKIGNDQRHFASIEEVLLEQLHEVQLSLQQAYQQSLKFSEHASVVQKAEVQLRRLQGKKAQRDDSIEIETRILPWTHQNSAEETPTSQGAAIVRPPPIENPHGSPISPPAEQPPSLPCEIRRNNAPPAPKVRKERNLGGNQDNAALSIAPLLEQSTAAPSEALSIAPLREQFITAPSEEVFLQDAPEIPQRISAQTTFGMLHDSGEIGTGDLERPQQYVSFRSDTHGSSSIAASIGQKRVRGFDVHQTWNVRNVNASHFLSTRQSMAPLGGQRISEEGEFAFVASAAIESPHGKDHEKAHDVPDHCFVLSPYSPLRATWDAVSLVLVMYDLIMIPFALLDPPDILFTDIMTWTTRVFWTVDVFMSLITGITLDDGHIELRWRAIIRRYLRQWFLLDIIIVGSDWGEYILSDSGLLGSGGSGIAKAGKAGRAFRIIRMLRLLRLARMREVIDLMLERIRSERLTILAGALRMTSIIMGLAHILACVWWGIGSSDEDKSWILKHEYEREPLFYRYFMTLHWSLSQFAGGMDEVTPANTQERIYTICVFLTCFVAAAAFVSTLTSSMTQLNIIGSQHSQQLSQMRKYLYQNGITNRLALRVMRNAKHAVQEQQKMMPEDNVPLLRVVSEPLRLELHFEMFSPILNLHPWIHRYSSECPQVMRKVCHLATRFEIVSTGDVIFNVGEIPARPVMYIVVYGDLVYTNQGVETEVNVGCSISEATLWTQWMHRGVLTATSDCRLCLLDSKIFQEIVGSFHHIDFNPRTYANGFVNALNEMDLQDVTDLTFFEQLIPKRGNKTLSSRSTLTSAVKLNQVLPSGGSSPAHGRSLWSRFSGTFKNSGK